MRISIPTKRIKTADFELWLPEKIVDKTQTLRAVLVLSGGSNQDGRHYLARPEWQKFAEEEGLALVGTFFQDKDPSTIEGYCRAHEESGECLLWALKRFAKDTGIPEIASKSLFLYGFSAGGQFNYEMNAAYPGRVGAFVVNKGGIYYTALVPEMARYTDGLFILGKKDEHWRQDVIRGLLSVNRRGGAKWFLLQEDCAHAEGESPKISREFFKRVLDRWTSQKSEGQVAVVGG